MATTLVTTMEVDGLQRTLADWGIGTEITKVTRSMAADTLNFSITVRQGADAPPINAESMVIVRLNVEQNNETLELNPDTGTVDFVGKVTEIPGEIGPDNESYAYTVSGPWAEFETITFQQTWYSWNGLQHVEPPHLPYYEGHDTTHVIVPWNRETGPLTVEEQIAEAINYAITRSGMVIELGVLDLIRTLEDDGFDADRVALNEYRDITIAELIKQMCKWCPDAVAWFDYSNVVAFVPTPVFHCKLWKRLDTITIPLQSGTKVRHAITPRYDLQRTGVVFRFEKTDVVGEKTVFSVTEQKWPPGITGAEPGCVVATFDMKGAKQTYNKATIECLDNDAMSTDPALRLAFWKERHPWLKSTYLRNVSVDLATRTGVEDLPRWLKSGSIAPWLEEKEGITMETESIRVFARYEMWSAETGGELQNQPGMNGKPPHILTFEMNSTDAESGDYSDVKENEPGEPIPSNLAKFFYDGVQHLQHSGVIEDTSQECIGTMRIGKRVNLTQGLPGWATMQAGITTVTERYHLGSTAAEIGPPARLGPQDMIDLLRVNRRERQRWTSTRDAASGESTNAAVTAGKWTPSNNSTSGPVTSAGGTALWR